MPSSREIYTQLPTIFLQQMMMMMMMMKEINVSSRSQNITQMPTLKGS